MIKKTKLAVFLTIATALLSPAMARSSAGADWDKIVAGDRQAISSGMLPPNVLHYDAQIAKLMSQAQSILNTKDKARARVWSREMDALMTARSNTIAKYSTAQAASANALASALGNGRPDPCLDPMGRNRCTPPPQPEQQQQRMCETHGAGGPIDRPPATTGLVPC